MKGVGSSLFLSFLHWKLCRITYLETSIHISLSGNWCSFICVCAEWSVEGRGPCLEEALSFWGWGFRGEAADLGLCNVGTHRRQCLWQRGASPAGERAGFGAGLGKNDSSFNPEAGRMMHSTPSWLWERYQEGIQTGRKRVKQEGTNPDKRCETAHGKQQIISLNKGITWQDDHLESSSGYSEVSNCWKEAREAEASPSRGSWAARLTQGRLCGNRKSQSLQLCFSTWLCVQIPQSFIKTQMPNPTLEALNHSLQGRAQQVCFRRTEVILMCLMMVNKKGRVNRK